MLYVVAYPIWFILWMGDLVTEPHHLVLFAIFSIGSLAGSVFYRFR